MEIEQVAELARAVAALPEAKKDFFDGLVADERAKAAAEARVAKLRGMSDLDAVEAAIKQASNVFALEVAIDQASGVVALGELPERLLHALREAGFVRTGGVTLEQAFRAGFRSSAEGWNYETKGEQAFARQAFKDEMAQELSRLKPKAE